MTISDKLALLEQTKEAQRVKLGLPKNLPFSQYIKFIRDPFTFSELYKNGEQGIWLDPSDLKTMFQDVNGTEPVTKDGDPVALIKDKSGKNNHATQSVATSRPIYRTDGILHWLEFDGIDDYLSAQIVGLSNFSSFIAGASFTTSKPYSVIFSGWDNSNRVAFNNITMIRDGAFYRARSNSGDLTGPRYNPVGNVFTYVSDGSKLQLINPITGDRVDFTPSKIFATDTLYIGSAPETHGISALQGKIWGVVVANGVTNTDTALQVDKILKLKAGLPL